MSTADERFDAKWKIDPATGCHLWTAARTGSGYGNFGRGGRAAGYVTAHVFAYQRAHGPVPVGLELDHLCRVRHCVNPAHLEAVTRRENLMRGNTVVAKNASATHCPSGHPLSGANLRLQLRPGKTRPERRCRTCCLAQGRAYDERRRSASPERPTP